MCQTTDAQGGQLNPNPNQPSSTSTEDGHCAKRLSLAPNLLRARAETHAPPVPAPPRVDAPGQTPLRGSLRLVPLRSAHDGLLVIGTPLRLPHQPLASGVSPTSANSSRRTYEDSTYCRCSDARIHGNSTQYTVAKMEGSYLSTVCDGFSLLR